ncbi:DExH-box ATP-dependent RNA helicase [Nymphaea thermarum]|nr:DExH-box ATP-dependent RNA helicase [Nymphaea thermarum]
MFGPILASRSRSYCGYAIEQFSDDEYEVDFEGQKASPSVANIDEWRWKLSMLLRNQDEQEIVSKDKRDRHDYEQISNLAKRMGLYSEQYGKVIVASKVPLPNYRPDLDEKRPQREVVVPLSLQRRVEGLLQEHVDRMQFPLGIRGGNANENETLANEIEDDLLAEENEDPMSDASIREKILQRRSVRMRNLQRSWQVKMNFSVETLVDTTHIDLFIPLTYGSPTLQESPEGLKMLAFRKSLPAYREKERLLSAIARNQVIVVSGETGCGKTTQLPQYILESEIESGRGAFCNIICTQPRRISAMAVAERVAAERGEELGESGFTYPVSAYYLEDILEKTGYKLTSFNQVDDYGQDKLWKTQRQLLTRKKKNQLSSLAEDALSKANFENYSSRTRDSLASWTPDCIGFNLIEAVLCHICRKERPGGVLVFMTGWDDISSLRDQLKAHPLLGDPNRVLLLSCHGSMATSEQKIIFERPPPNIRKIVLATNMAEASITINDIVFVVDCGKAKETSYDALNNTPCLLPSWISKASARQVRLVGSIAEFLSAALQPPEPLAVQNAIDFLKLIGALDGKENLTNLGRYLSMLPVDPKLGKMLIMGAVFRCLDPILTILAGTAKSRFSAKDYSDHMALVRAYEGWKDADREGSAYEYCWRNFLSAQTFQAIHSLRKQFNFILKDAGLLDGDANICNSLSHNQSLVRAVICSGLFPGIVSVVHREKSMSFKTMDDGQVLLYVNSVNSRYQTIPYPWLVFSEKVKVNAVFIRDSTGISDSILILFGGIITRGSMAGHLKMLEGYIDLFMEPSMAELYWNLKEELDKLIQRKLEDPTLDIHKVGKYLMLAVQELVSADQCEGRFVFGRESKKRPSDANSSIKHHTNPKSLLQTLLMRAGHTPPRYKTKHLRTNEFRALVEFKGMQFVGKPKRNKQLAERDAAIEALGWLTHTSDKKDEEDDSPPDLTENMFKLLTKPRKSKHRRS